MIRYSKVNYEDVFKPPMMSLFVISACNLQCGECIMLSQMHKHPAYQMSLEEMERFLFFTEKSGYMFHYRYTGGEPLYWKNLSDGTKMLRRSPSCKSILLMTNAMKHESLTDEIVSMIDYIRISQYGYNEIQMKELEVRYPNKVKIVNREVFYPHPETFIENALPVDCGNFEHLYFDSKVYACPHSYTLALRHGLNHLELGVEVGMNYCEKNIEIREGHVDICKLCVGNKKVRDQFDKVANISNRHDKLVQLKVKK